MIHSVMVYTVGPLVDLPSHRRGLNRTMSGHRVAASSMPPLSGRQEPLALLFQAIEHLFRASGRCRRTRSARLYPLRFHKPTNELRAALGSGLFENHRSLTLAEIERFKKCEQPVSHHTTGIKYDLSIRQKKGRPGDLRPIKNTGKGPTTPVSFHHLRKWLIIRF